MMLAMVNTREALGDNPMAIAVQVVVIWIGDLVV